MGVLIKGHYIPGTVLNREKMGGVTGDAFLSNIFFVTDGPAWMEQLFKIG